jgi:predicted esterase
LSGAIAFEGARHASDGRLTGFRAFYGRGTLDDVIPRELVSQTEAYLRGRSGAKLTYREYRHGHSISRAELEDVALWFES